MRLAVGGEEERDAVFAALEIQLLDTAGVALGLGEDFVDGEADALGFDNGEDTVVGDEGVVGGSVGGGELGDGGVVVAGKRRAGEVGDDVPAGFAQGGIDAAFAGEGFRALGLCRVRPWMDTGTGGGGSLRFFVNEVSLYRIGGSGFKRRGTGGGAARHGQLFVASCWLLARTRRENEGTDGDRAGARWWKRIAEPGPMGDRRGSRLRLASGSFSVWAHTPGSVRFAHCTTGLSFVAVLAGFVRRPRGARAPEAAVLGSGGWAGRGQVGEGSSLGVACGSFGSDCHRSLTDSRCC